MENEKWQIGRSFLLRLDPLDVRYPERRSHFLRRLSPICYSRTRNFPPKFNLQGPPLGLAFKERTQHGKRRQYFYAPDLLVNRRRNWRDFGTSLCAKVGP